MVDSTSQDESQTQAHDPTEDDAPLEAAQPQGDPTSASASSMSSELADANDRALRAQAELENFRKRMRRELEDTQRYAAVPVLRDLLTVADDLHRAIEAAEQSSDAAGLLAGVRMVQKHFDEVLANHGCQKVDADGAQFDPSVHEAILQQPSEEHEPGSVMHVAKDGYVLHDRVIRPAQVIVAAKPEGN